MSLLSTRNMLRNFSYKSKNIAEFLVIPLSPLTLEFHKVVMRFFKIIKEELDISVSYCLLQSTMVCYMLSPKITWK